MVIILYPLRYALHYLFALAIQLAVLAVLADGLLDLEGLFYDAGGLMLGTLSAICVDLNYLYVVGQHWYFYVVGWLFLFGSVISNQIYVLTLCWFIL